MMLNKTILIDCDGVLLNWIDSFIQWMNSNGHVLNKNFNGGYNIEELFDLKDESVYDYVEQFNNSTNIGFLSPMPDAKHYVKQFVNQGFRFKVITSLSDNTYSAKLRKKNLRKIFGDWAIEEIICLPLKKSKFLELSRQKGLYDKNIKTIWIEDHLDNADAGRNLGFETIVYAHHYNIGWSGPRFHSWKQIYEYVMDFQNSL